MPKLTRILEGKESKTIRRKRGSTVGSIDGTTRRVNRPVDAAGTRNRSHRQKYSSPQQTEKNLAGLQNPSLLSVLSGVTQDSSASNESNSTITQQSYDKKLVDKSNSTQDKKQVQIDQEPSTDEPPSMTSQPNVFQYMEEIMEPTTFTQNENHSARSSSVSSSSASSDDSDHGGSSSIAEPIIESPPTSPASTRKLYSQDSHEDDETGSDNSSEASTRLKYQPSVVEAVPRSSGQRKHGSDNESDDASRKERRQAHSASGDEAQKPLYATHMALERAPPPRASSTSSHRSDRHTRRMKRQEQAMQAHLLQNPQPQRDFQFTGVSSPPYPAPVPPYDPYSLSRSSPASFTHATRQAPPVAPQPPPSQAVGYYSPARAPAPPASYASGFDNEFALATRPPMAPSVVTQSSQPQYPPAQAPHYQTRPPEPKLPKPTRVGYELIAEKISKGSENGETGSEKEHLVPMYRKFENLNHRVLLHLQDEISELEEELRYLDECIAQSVPRDYAGQQYPASRRGDARYGGEMHNRRTELLGRIYLKLGQYSKTPTSPGPHMT